MQTGACQAAIVRKFTAYTRGYMPFGIYDFNIFWVKYAFWHI